MLRERLGKELLYFDGGMGTLLQERGLQPGELPETWNLLHAEEIREIHRKYIEAGSDIVLTNTFGANALKFHDDAYSLEEIVNAAVGHVKAVEWALKNQKCEEINLGTGNGTSVLQLREAFEKASGVKIPYVIDPRRPGDPDEVYADATKAAKLLGWKAEHGIEEMCEDTWRWQSNNPNGYDD